MSDLWILDDLPVGVWVASAPDGTATYSNKMFERIMGQRSVADSRIGDTPETYGLYDRAGNRYPPEDLPFSRAVATRAPVVVDDIVVRRPDREVHVRAFGTPIFGQDGAITHVIVAFVDISREVTAENERRRVEERLAFACNHSPIAIWMTDAKGVVTISEGAGLASLGVKPGELVGKALLELYAQHPTIPGFIRRGLQGESFWYTGEVGDAVFDSWLAPVKNETGEIIGLTGVSHDVSQLRKLQKTAIQNDRVVALGTLAASVAHEINNPLTYVVAQGDRMAREIEALEQLAKKLDPGALASELHASVARLREDLAPIRDGAHRIASITRDLRTFSRPDDNTLQPVDVGHIVDAAVKLVAKEVEARARLVVAVEPTPAVMGNDARLLQVVLNLLLNAVHAVDPTAPGRNEIRVGTRVHGAHVVIEVADTGPGIPVAERERVFEPFYTTKSIGQGTGLGLFVSRNIARGLSGDIQIADRPGGGALLRVTLPAVAPAPPAEPVAPVLPPAARATPARRTQTRPVPANGARVVLIEDDTMVARALSLQLRHTGYEVTIFSDGAAALPALLGDQAFDLAYCDLMMTGMNGMQLADELQRQAPDVLDKVVFMTGGAFSAIARDFVARNRARTVDKPFDVVGETERRLDKRPRD